MHRNYITHQPAVSGLAECRVRHVITLRVLQYLHARCARGRLADIGTAVAVDGGGQPRADEVPWEVLRILDAQLRGRLDCIHVSQSVIHIGQARVMHVIR